MKILLKLFTIFIMVMLLTGCWDQVLLKDISLVYSIGMDKTDKGELEATISIPKGQNEESQEATSQVVSGVGKTLREVRSNIDKTVPGFLDASKVRVFIVNQELAELDLYAIVDQFYRDPRAPLASRVVISEAKSKNLINLKVESAQMISEYLINLVESAEENTIVPKLNLQYICPTILDIGKDFHLPLMNIDTSSGKEQAKITGTALFNNKKMTGTLTSDESTMGNLLNNYKGQTVTFTTKVSDEGEGLEALNHITYQVDDYDREINIESNGNALNQVDINLKLFLNVTEYASNELAEESTVLDLNNKIKEDLNVLAESTVEKLQVAKCDLLGIGREVIAYHNQSFDAEEDWKEIYAELPINVNVDVEIIYHGIIN